METTNTNTASHKQKAPVVGGTIASVTDDMVTTTGYRASKLLGADIYNDQGEKVGLLNDFIVGDRDEVSVAVIAVGGFLGMGARMVAVPASLLEGNDEGQMVLPIATKEKLKALPEFCYAEDFPKSNTKEEQTS